MPPPALAEAVGPGFDLAGAARGPAGASTPALAALAERAAATEAAAPGARPGPGAARPRPVDVALRRRGRAARAALLARRGDRARSWPTGSTPTTAASPAVLDALGHPQLADLPAERPDVDAARAPWRGRRGGQGRTPSPAAPRSTAPASASTSWPREHRPLAWPSCCPLEADAELHEPVANRCAGKVAPKVSLQRWVLATYLEGICEHANRRLATMTAGRYQLRVDRDAIHAAAKAGLDLWVLDAHTGTERPVSSLSGGETFQASLALALGVADSVEARTGGVRLDALFVDEGFGTLDPEALQLAMDELDGLREGGRMVGLISHVGALRERIRVGIEVTPTDHGSTVRVGDIAAA